MSTTIKFKRGNIAAVEVHILEEGEPAFSTDTKEFFIGDGTSSGGVFIGPTDIDDVTPTITKGDIMVDDGSTVRRLPVGTDTQVLTADSATELGIKWAGP